MNDQYVRNVIEAALLAAGRPLTMDEMVSVFDERDGSGAEEVRGAIAALTRASMSRAASRSLEVASGFGSRSRAVGRGTRIAAVAGAAGEVFAGAARDPGAGGLPPADHPRRDRADPRRGGQPEHHQDALERGWIRVVGHRDVPGKPELLGTTREFLDYFSLKKLDDLPTLAQLKELEDLRVQLSLPGADAGAGG